LTPLVKKLPLPLIVCALFLGCNTVSDVTPTEGGDLDWARAIADGVVADLYDQGLVMYRAEATCLDFFGILYDGVQHPYWRFSYINSDVLVRIVVHPDGSTTVTEDVSYFENQTEFAFTSTDVVDWLDLAQYCYRYITGCEDDVCYGLGASCSEYGSTAFVTLYDRDIEGLAWVSIDLETGQLDQFVLL
jgi:hypothetical protein